MALQEQLSRAQVVDRDYTVVGCYSTLMVPSDASASTATYSSHGPLSGPCFESQAVEHGGGTLLWFEAGRASCLEMYAHGDYFPADHSDLGEFKLSGGASPAAAAGEPRSTQPREPKPLRGSQLIGEDVRWSSPMPLVRTRISVAGFAEAEVRDGLEHLLAEFRERSWIIQPAAFWDAVRGRLVVTTHYEGADADACGRAASDEVSDCVIACFNFASEGIHFDVEESVVVPKS